MMYVDFNAGNKEYKLRLNTRGVVALEKKLGCNPLTIFGDGDTIPTVTTMVDIFHASLQAYQHGINIESAFDIFDKWLEDGHTTIEFAEIIIEIYKASGIVPEEVGSTEEAVQSEKN